MIFKFLVLVVLAYLFGSVPFGLILAKIGGKDLRSIGSGNIGATNVARALGRKWAYVCFVLDMLKGLVPMLVAMGFVSEDAAVGELFGWLAVGCAAILGHIFPIYIRFKGGKGVATGFGMVLGLWPYYTICGLIAGAVWLVCVFIWRYISLASITAAVVFPVSLVAAILILPGWELAVLWPLVVVAVVIAVLLVLRHRENIKRLLAGTEYKVMQK